jgi:hypothetical protein
MLASRGRQTALIFHGLGHVALLFGCFLTTLSRTNELALAPGFEICAEGRVDFPGNSGVANNTYGARKRKVNAQVTACIWYNAGPKGSVLSFPLVPFGVFAF